MLVALSVMLCVGAYAQAKDSQPSDGPLEFPLPQFMNPIYDGFTQNFTNAAATGRGYTGKSRMGSLNQVLQNPASAMIDEGQFYIDMSIKPPMDELNRDGDSRYTSPVPFGMFAIGTKLSEKFNIALAYSVPKSIVQDDYSVILGQGASLLQRYPTYYLHQITASVGYHHNDFHAGINLHNQLHYLDDIIFFRTFDRVKRQAYVLRPELGLLYQAGNFGFGFTAMPPQDMEVDTPYAVYESVLPLKMGGGITFTHQNRSFSLEAEFEQCSEISSAFEDRLSLFAGYEQRIGLISYKLGFINRPGVFEGEYVYPAYLTDDEEINFAWQDVATGGRIPKNDQNLITAGFTFHHREGTVNVSLLQDAAGRYPVTQVNISLSLYLSFLKGKPQNLTD